MLVSGRVAPENRPSHKWKVVFIYFHERTVTFKEGTFLMYVDHDATVEFSFRGNIYPDGLFVNK